MIKNSKNSISIRNGFTLAEVLITLVIIGIIAAMTIPTLMKNTEKQEFVVGLKKSYSTLQQTFYKMAMEKGASIGDLSYVQDSDFFDTLTHQLNAIKVCHSANSGCFYSGNTQSLKGQNWAKYDRINSFITADGVTYSWSDGTLCSGKGLTSDDEANCVGRFIVDVNGFKGPNKFGRDTFFFIAINGKGIVPAGQGNNAADCRTNSDGITCAAKVIKENAMNY